MKGFTDVEAVTESVILAECPWVHEHERDYFPKARFDFAKKKFTCIHPCCLHRTLDEALSQLAPSAAETVLSVNTGNEK